MRAKLFQACILTCAFVAGASCGSDEASPNSAGSGGTGAAGSGGTSGRGGSPTGGTGGGGTSGTGGGGGTTVDGGSVSVSGKVVDVSQGDATKNFDATKYPALAGVEVCVYENTSLPCVTTDATGDYDLAGIPRGGRVYLSFKKAGYTPYLYAIETSQAGIINPPAMLVSTTAFTETWGTNAGVPVDSTKGTILFGALTVGPSTTPFRQMFGTTELFYLEGFQVTISPAATAGPVYTSAAWAPDRALTASSAAGWGFIQAAPGDYTLTITHPGYTCGTTQTKVVAGYSTTYVGVLCSVPDGGVPDGSTPDGSSDASQPD